MRIVLTITGIIIQQALFAIQLDFVKKYGLTNNEHPLELAYTKQNEIVIAGYYGTVSSLNDIFINKYDNNGTQLLFNVGGGLGDDYIYDFTTDTSGNIYVIGSFQKNCILYKNTSFTTKDTLLGNDSSHFFIAKYNSSATLLWKIYGQGPGRSEGLGITVDKNNFVYVSGYSTDSLYFNISGSLSYTKPVQEKTSFLGKIDSSGAFISWIKTTGGSEASDIKIDASDRLYITGYLVDTTFFGAIQVNVADKQAGYITKFQNNGNLVWVKSFEGNANNVAFGNKIALDSNNDLYVTGGFTNNATIGTTVLVGYGNYDMFFAKYSTTGQFQWANKLGANGPDNSYAINVSDNNYITLCGYVRSTVNEAYYNGDTFNLYGVNDIWGGIFNTSGQLIQHIVAGSVGGSDVATGMVLKNDTTLYLSGEFSSKAYFENDSLTVSGGTDIFLAKYTISPHISNLINNNAYCINDTVSFTIKTIGEFSSGNSFDIILSDSSGSFNQNTTILGSFPSLGDTNVSVLLPLTITNSSNYNIKVVSSNPSGRYVDYTAKEIKYLPVSISPQDSTICLGTSATLSVPAIYDTYLWGAGQTSTSINPNKAGKYSIKVSKNGCYYYDTTNLYVDSANFNILSDPIPNLLTPFWTYSCAKDSITFYSDKTDFATYEWRKGTTFGIGTTIGTDSVLEYFAVGFTGIHLKVTTINGCNRIKTQSVSVTAAPPGLSGADIYKLCKGDTVGIYPWPCSECKYIWSNGETTPVIQVSEEAVYSVEIIDTTVTDCSVFDSVRVYKDDSVPYVHFADTIKLCPDSILVLNVGGKDLLDSSYIYFWNIGSTDSIMNIDSTGMYIVEVSNLCAGTTVQDSIFVLKLDTCIDNSPLGVWGKENGHLLFEIYPNPTDGVIFINQYSINRTVNIKIMTLSGQTVFADLIIGPKSTINLSSMEKGYYFVEVNNDYGKYLTRLIIF